MWLVTTSGYGQQNQQNWDPPAVRFHPDHDAVVRDFSLISSFIEAGRQLFKTKFNVIDGAGRPEATGDSKPTIRLRRDLPLFNRVAGPDANSCAGCHNEPAQGGSGDFTANVFVGAHFTDPPTTSTDPAITNERNTISIFGAGALEMLAREMTEDLLSIRDQALKNAREEDKLVTRELKTKGVSLGVIVARPDGSYDVRGVHGVDEDLVIKPFGAKGVAVSIREFTNFALNQHHGIQPQERFGWERTGRTDFDGDAVEIEFTIGQVSALTLYQASLPPPKHVVYRDPQRAALAQLGERKFNEVGCTKCHIPALPLESRFFTEPNFYNRPGSAVPADVQGQISVPIRVSESSGVYQGSDGKLYVAAYTDLKRHRICDVDDPYFCNEKRPQDFVPTDQFLTAKLWDAGTSAPYGHRGDLTTVSEAILHHSAEAKTARDRFLKLTDQEKRGVVLFLLSLQVKPDEEPKNVQSTETQE
jgi:cytochrome c peroxidase